MVKRQARTYLLCAYGIFISPKAEACRIPSHQQSRIFRPATQQVNDRNARMWARELHDLGDRRISGERNAANVGNGGLWCSVDTKSAPLLGHYIYYAP
jgi:hypothetical protein